MRSNVKWITAINAVVMFFVLLMGALVTKTGSGQGCGDDFPLCNGKFVPAHTVESMIEYSHRAVSGLAGIIVLVAAICVWRTMRHRRDAIVFALSGFFFTFLQAVLGAIAVLHPQSSAVLALHFGFSLLAFASTLLLAIVVFGKDGTKTRGFSSTSVSIRFRRSVWFISLYCYIVVYIGAFVRHSNSMGGCTGWPLCNGRLIPELSGATGIVFMHRVAAGLLFLMICWLFAAAERNAGMPSAVRWACRWAFLFVVLQVSSGALVTFMLSSDSLLFADMLHTLLIACLFSTLMYLCVLMFKLGRTELRSV